MNKKIDDPDWLQEQYQHRTIQSIADELGVARNTVRNRMIALGVVRRKKTEHFKGVPKSQEHRVKLSKARKKYWDQHSSKAERDAHKLKVSKARRKHGMAKGRVRIYVLGKGRVFRHRHVAEEAAGRKLDPIEQVHHKDRNKINDAPDNLQVLSNSDHQKLHNLTRPRNEKGQYTR